MFIPLVACLSASCLPVPIYRNACLSVSCLPVPIYPKACLSVSCLPAPIYPNACLSGSCLSRPCLPASMYPTTFLPVWVPSACSYLFTACLSVFCMRLSVSKYLSGSLSAGPAPSMFLLMYSAHLPRMASAPNHHN